MLYDEMLKKAEELKFEEAEALKKRYILLDNYCAKSEVVSFSIADVDVFTITDDEFNRTAFINYLHVKNGTVNQSFTFEYKYAIDLTAKRRRLSCLSRWNGPCARLYLSFHKGEINAVCWNFLR